MMKFDWKIDWKNINWLTVLKEYSAFMVGLSLFVIAWVSFILPHHITGGGVTGISTIIYYATNGFIPISYSYFFINLFLLILGTLILGKGFGFKTVFCIIVSSLMFEFYPHFMWVSDIEGKLLNSIVGGAVAGLGLSMVLLNGGSTGGTDILVLIINKYKQISPGKLFLLFDVIIIASYLFLPDMHFKDLIYGFLVMVALSYVLDLVMNGVQSSVQVMIFSKEYEKMAELISKEVNRGITMFYSQGWYSQEDGKTLIVIARQKELSGIKKIIKEVDPTAFYSTTPTSTVNGRGFSLPKNL